MHVVIDRLFVIARMNDAERQIYVRAEQGGGAEL